MRTEEEEREILQRHKAEHALKKARTQREPTDSLIKRGGFKPAQPEES